MKITDELKRLEEQFHAVLLEFAYLKEKIEILEDENEQLRYLLYQNKQKELGSCNELNNLYNEGFHICPEKFAQTRNEDCLFCFGFLKERMHSDEK